MLHHHSQRANAQLNSGIITFIDHFVFLIAPQSNIQTPIYEPYSALKQQKPYRLEHLYSIAQEFIKTPVSIAYPPHPNRLLPTEQESQEYWNQVITLIKTQLISSKTIESTNIKAFIYPRNIPKRDIEPLVAKLGKMNKSALHQQLKSINSQFKSNQNNDFLMTYLFWLEYEYAKCCIDLYVARALEHRKSWLLAEINTLRQNRLSVIPESISSSNDITSLSSHIFESTTPFDLIPKSCIQNPTTQNDFVEMIRSQRFSQYSKYKGNQVENKPKLLTDASFEQMELGWKAEKSRLLNDHEMETIHQPTDIIQSSHNQFFDQPDFCVKQASKVVWTNYNKAKYTEDNPPPPIISGYQFHIYYPKLVGSSIVPTYKIVKIPENDTSCKIVFVSGPPYQDIAFIIPQKPWLRSHKTGFRCEFSQGVFRLFFRYKDIVTEQTYRKRR